MSNDSQRFLRFGPTIDGSKHDLIPADKNIYEIINSNPKLDYYTSLYNYASHHVEQFKKTHSVAGIRDVKTNRLVFDLDSKTNQEQTRTDALTVCERLIANGIPEDKLKIFFSGGKGFHVEVTSKQELTRPEFENIVFGIASDLQTFDTKIKDEARVIRTPLTRHPQSGLYKIPLLLDELKNNSVEEIRKIAKSPKGFDPSDLSDSKFSIDLPEKLLELKTKAQEKKVVSPTENDLSFDIREIDFSKCPRWMPKERYALAQGYFYGSESVDTGERNTAFMILAATYKNAGFDADQTLALLCDTARKQARRTGETEKSEQELRQTVISPVFSIHWKGGIYSSTEELLVKTRERFGIEDVPEEVNGLVKIDEVGAKFKKFAENFHENRIFTGIDALDKKIVLTTSMAVGILGAPSSGKTSILNKIVRHQSENGIPTIYQSLDMGDNLLYLRLLQQYTKLPIEYIIEEFQSKNVSEKLLTAYNDVLKSYSNVHFNFRSAMTVEIIDRDIDNYIEQTGIAPKLIAIDYLEKVHSEMSDPTASSGLVASQLSDLAKKHQACVIVLLQPQKAAGGPEEPLLSMRRVKGASQIEQDLRCILTVWRPGFSPQKTSDDRYLSLACVKNNLGSLCQLDFNWSGIDGEISNMNELERRGLRDLLQRIADEKAAKRDDF